MNVQKSVLKPTKNIEYLGFEYNLIENDIFYRVKQKCFLDYKIQIIKMFAQGNLDFTNKILDYEINRKFLYSKTFQNLILI